MTPADRVYVAGHDGMVGSAIVRRLQGEGFTDLVVRGRSELDLRDPAAVRGFFLDARPQYVFLAAARVGGILANDRYPADFIADNLAIELAVVDAAYRAGVQKLLFLGSSCVYPRLAPQPIREEYLLEGALEATNEWYALAKIAGIKLCQAYRKQYGADFINVMPTNLYGPNDNFDLESSHVLPALLRRFHEAQGSGAPSVTLWGTGTPRREFLHVDDLADACVYLMRHYSDAAPINIGWGRDISIAELADMVKDVTGYEGHVHFDATKPDGTPRKLLDTAKLNALGWCPAIPLRDGIRTLYEWFVAHGVSETAFNETVT